jgi:hypothetical protein
VLAIRLRVLAGQKGDEISRELTTLGA